LTISLWDGNAQVIRAQLGDDVMAREYYSSLVVEIQ
jgi:hypothetical protein